MKIKQSSWNETLETPTWENKKQEKKNRKRKNERYEVFIKLFFVYIFSFFNYMHCIDYTMVLKL